MDFLYTLKNNKLIALFISISGNIILIIICITFIYKLYNYNCPLCEYEDIKDVIEDVESNCETTNNSFYVEVKGAVKKPGVYEVSNNNIINDLITLAGGFNKNAYTNNINLSKRLSRELVVYVYTKSEYKKDDSKVEIKETICECPTYEISDCIDDLASEIVNENNDITKEESISKSNVVSEHNSTNTELININLASKDELMSLPGIGESKAIEIINYRNNNGTFALIEDIKNVSGIGNAIYEKIKGYITV